MKLIIKNKKAYYEYTIIEKYIVGLQLQGSEVKSIKASNVSIVEAFCLLVNGELFIKGMHVSEYKQSGTSTNHNPIRERKLLLNKKELVELAKGLDQKGLTIVPLAVLQSQSGFIKVEVALVKGKKVYDKRNSIKEKDLKREMEKKF